MGQPTNLTKKTESNSALYPNGFVHSQSK